MANKLAGQKMKFTKARFTYYSTDDDNVKGKALLQMADVLAWTRGAGVSEDEVTQGYEFPEQARQGKIAIDAEISDADADLFIRQVEEIVDQSNVQTRGMGPLCVYAYGYRCAPDRLKIGRCDGDVILRITNQINTSTPDKPVLNLVIRTSDCRSLEKALHGVLQVRGRKVSGGGDEWFHTNVNELIQIYEFCMQKDEALVFPSTS